MPSTPAAVPNIDPYDVLKHVRTMKTTKYLHIALFFVIAIIVAYFIVRIVLSFTSVYTKYISLNNDLATRKRQFTIPGAELTSVDDDNLDDADVAGTVYLNDAIENSLMNMEHTQSQDVQGIVNYRKNSKNGANYKFGANVSANVLSSEFDDYVYAEPKPQEQSFWEYLFNPTN